MKYFEIYSDVTIGHLPQIENRYNEYESQKEERYIVFFLMEDKDVLLPGILVAPYFMISEDIQKVLKKYEPNFEFQNVTFIDQINNSNIEYYMPKIPIFETIEEGKKSDKVLFCIEETYVKHYIVRLDFMESILRREKGGFLIKEV